jgi:hypothetical protein
MDVVQGRLEVLLLKFQGTPVCALREVQKNPGKQTVHHLSLPVPRVPSHANGGVSPFPYRWDCVKAEHLKGQT